MSLDLPDDLDVRPAPVVCVRVQLIMMSYDGAPSNLDPLKLITESFMGILSKFLFLVIMTASVISVPELNATDIFQMATLMHYSGNKQPFHH